jgi:hypothetical protein
MIQLEKDKTVMTAIDLAKKYNDFQSEIGRSAEGNFETTISSLFTEQFRKTANGEILVHNRSALKDQLGACREMAGNWTIDVKDIAAFDDPRRCLIRYHLVSDKLGVFDVMATLRSDSNGRIEEVDEVYYIVSNA